MDANGHVIGIDLGTTNSVVAVIDGGEPVVIANQEGRTKTPSVVAIGDAGQVTVGEIARRQAATQPERMISSAKRLIGRMYAEIGEEEGLYPFKLAEHEDGRVAIQVEDALWLPEQISAMVLARLKEAAEAYLGESVTRAVVTVPAYFDDMQRTATLEAARMAGLEVLRLINEPTAAAMAYGLGRGGREVVAVYDFGGGTFDFSVLEIDDKTFEVLVSTGNSRLGGDDLDAVLVDHLADAFEAAHGIDLRAEPLTLRRLKDAAERAKCELSSAYETLVTLPFITYREGEPLHLEQKLDRETLEELIEPLVRETLDCCARGIRQARVRKNEIGRVILVGGSTRIPLVQDHVEEYFGLPPFKGVNPDEIVAVGAATQGAVMNGELEEVVLLDVTPHTLGIETRGNKNSVIIERNSTIPIKVSKTFSTTEDNQTFVNIHVLQGEGEKVSECRSLGRFTLSGIQDAAAGVPRIRVTFFINADGIVDISAADLQSGAEHSLQINHAYLSSDERRQQSGGERRSRRRRRGGAVAAEIPSRAAESSSNRPSEPLPIANPATASAENLGESGRFAEVHGDTDMRRPKSPKRARPVEPVPEQIAPREAKPRTSGTPARRGGGGKTAPASRPAPMAAHSPVERRHGGERVEEVTPAAVNAAAAETGAGTPVQAGTQGYGKQEAVNAQTQGMPARRRLTCSVPVPRELSAVVEGLVMRREDEEARKLYEGSFSAFKEFCAEHLEEAALQLLLARLLTLLRQAEESRELLAGLTARQAAPVEDLLEAYDALCTEFPNYLAARQDRAVLANQAGRIEQAIEDLEAVTEREDADEAVVGRLAELYEQALARQPDATMQFKMVRLHLRLRNVDRAVTILQQLVAHPDHRERASRVLGLCFWQKGMRHLAWQKLRGLPMTDELKDILYRLAADMEAHDELVHAKGALERIYEVDIGYRDVAERLKKLAYRLELQKDDRFGTPSAAKLAEGAGGELARRFEIIEEINRGSMGIVFKARDKILDEIVAIKVLNEFLCADPEAIERFKQEARSARRLTHQNVVRIHDMFDLDGKKIISMEYIEGENLKTLLSRNVTFSEDMVLTYLVQICEGLAYAHRFHIVHRDIKPANIMITDRNQVKITDFGIAKLLTEHQTKAGTMVMGTPLYMAPEQIEGGRIDHRCDIYALGIMMWEMVMGHPPFNEGNIEYQHIHSPVPEITVGVSERLSRIIMHCVKKNPQERFQTVEEILARII